ncbi:MAG: cytochrome c family protein [Rhizobiaceae bacterium]|nr:cytochrome c family protein [Rhizobiaceae bacterium]
MDSFTLNKYAMAFLAAVFVLMSASFISDSLFNSKAPEKPGFIISADEGETKPAQEGSQAPAYEPIAPLLATADLEAGSKVARKCLACHTFEKGGKKKVGPNLYNIIGKAMASVEGFAYSAPLKAFSVDKSWDYATLNGFLFKPKKYVKGTSMGFSGLKKTADRANIIAYIRSMADSPAPLPGE